MGGIPHLLFRCYRSLISVCTGWILTAATIQYQHVSPLVTVNNINTNVPAGFQPESLLNQGNALLLSYGTSQRDRRNDVLHLLLIFWGARSIVDHWVWSKDRFAPKLVSGQA